MNARPAPTGHGVNAVLPTPLQGANMLVNAVFAFVLIGIPAALGAHLVMNPSTERDTTAGATLIGFAAIAALVVALINPHGTLANVAFWLKLPAAFVAGVVIGAFTGWRRRMKGRDK